MREHQSRDGDEMDEGGKGGLTAAKGMYDRSPSRTGINNGRARIGDVSPARTRGLPADLRDGGPPTGGRKRGEGGQQREMVGERGCRSIHERLNYCTCDPLNHKNNKLHTAQRYSVALPCRATCLAHFARTRIQRRGYLYGCGAGSASTFRTD